MLGIGERPGGGVAHVHAVRIGQELQADGGVLEVVLPVVLGHPGALDPGVFLLEVAAPAVEDGIDHILVPAALEAVPAVVPEEQDLGLGNLLEGGLVQFHDLEGHDLGPAVVHVQVPVVIEQVRVAVAVAVQGADLDPFALARVHGLEHPLVVHRAAVQGAVHLHDGDHAARIVRGVHVRPVLEVGGVPVALAVRDEQEVVVLEDQDDGLAAPVGPFLADDDVQRIAEGLFGLRGGAERQQERCRRGKKEMRGFHKAGTFGDSDHKYRQKKRKSLQICRKISYFFQ